jgi:hypothetical protein
VSKLYLKEKVLRFFGFFGSSISVKKKMKKKSSKKDLYSAYDSFRFIINNLVLSLPSSKAKLVWLLLRRQLYVLRLI